MNGPDRPVSRAAPGREMAVTFDDLPIVSVTRGDVESHREITARLLAGVTAHRIPAVGFVNEQKLLAAGVAEPARVDLLRRWLDAGCELANHTFAHLDLHVTPAAFYEDDIVRGEPVIRGLLHARGMRLRYFRHPYLKTGTDLAVRRRIEAFLAGRGYTVAPVTVYTRDYLFAAAYDRALQRGDRGTAARVADAYVPYVERQLEYCEGLSMRVLGYDVRQILLLHANSINAERFDDLARMLAGRGYRIVTLERALEDEAYRAPDDYAGPWGLNWLQRWAMDRGAEGVLGEEPQPPAFVRALSGVGAEGRFARWWTRLHAARRAAAVAAGPVSAPGR